MDDPLTWAASWTFPPTWAASGRSGADAVSHLLGHSSAGGCADSGSARLDGGLGGPHIDGLLDVGACSSAGLMDLAVAAEEEEEARAMRSSRTLPLPSLF